MPGAAPHGGFSPTARTTRERIESPPAAGLDSAAPDIRAPAREPRAASESPGPTLPASDALTKVLRSAWPGRPGDNTLELAGARGEVVSGQAVCACPGTCRGAGDDQRPAAPDLGRLLPSSTVSLQWVRYIDIARNSSIPPDERVVQAPSSLPDPFLEGRGSIAEGRAGPAALDRGAQLPRTPPRATTRAGLTVLADGASVDLPVKLRVWISRCPRKAICRLSTGGARSAPASRGTGPTTGASEAVCRVPGSPPPNRPEHRDRTHRRVGRCGERVHPR